MAVASEEPKFKEELSTIEQCPFSALVTLQSTHKLCRVQAIVGERANRRYVYAPSNRQS